MERVDKGRDVALNLLPVCLLRSAVHVFVYEVPKRTLHRRYCLLRGRGNICLKTIAYLQAKQFCTGSIDLSRRPNDIWLRARLGLWWFDRMGEGAHQQHAKRRYQCIRLHDLSLCQGQVLRSRS